MLMLPRTVAAALSNLEFLSPLVLTRVLLCPVFYARRWFTGMVYCEVFLQLPFFFFATYAIMQGDFFVALDTDCINFNFFVSISIFFTRNAWCKCTCKRNHVHIVQETRRQTRRPCAFPTLTTRTTYVHYITNDIFHVVHVQ